MGSDGGSVISFDDDSSASSDNDSSIELDTPTSFVDSSIGCDNSSEDSPILLVKDSSLLLDEDSAISFVDD